MKCKQHITDGSSRVGVCASCLRERLFVLVEAQARSEAVLSLQQQIDHEDHRKSDPINNYHHSTQPQQPPLILPRSVSRSDIIDSSWHHQNQNSRFYSTPQLGPTNRTNLNDTADTNTSSCSTTHKKKSRFRILSNLFRSSNRSAVVVIDEQPRIPDPPSTISRASLSTSSPIPSSTWYSSLIPNRRKTTQESPCRSTTNHHHHRHRPHRNKGLSPKYTEEEEEYNIGGGEEDVNTIGYVSEASPGWRKSSSTTTPGRQRRGGQNGNNSKSVGMAFCLSPLVRPSPKRSSHKKDGGGLQTGFSAEIRVSSSVHNHNHHIPPNLSTAASFCANRSRKIANFGRANHYNNP